MSAAALVSANAALRTSDNVAKRQRDAGEHTGFDDILAALPRQATPIAAAESRRTDLASTAIGAATSSSLSSSRAGGHDEAAFSPAHFAASTWSPGEISEWALASAPRQIADHTSPPSAPIGSRGDQTAAPNPALARKPLPVGATWRPQEAIAVAPASNRESASSANDRKLAVVRAPSRRPDASTPIAAGQGLDPNAAMSGAPMSSAAILSAQSALFARAVASAQAPMLTAQSASLQTGSAAIGAREAMGGDHRPGNRIAVTDADLIGLTEIAVGARSVTAKVFHAPARPPTVGAVVRSQWPASPGQVPATPIQDGDTTGAQKRLPSPDAASHSQDGKGRPDDSGGGGELTAENSVAAIDVGIADAPAAIYSAGEILGLLENAATDLRAQAPPTIANAPQATAGASTKQLEIAMDPEGLGTLTATLTLSGGAISIVLEATSAEGESAMNAQLGALTSRLSAGAQIITSIRIIRADPDSRRTETSDATDFDSPSPSDARGARTAGTSRQFSSGRGFGGDMVV